MIFALIQTIDSGVPTAKQLSELTEKFGYATASNIAFMVVVLGLLGFLVYNVVGQLRNQTGSINKVQEAQAVILDRTAELKGLGERIIAALRKSQP